jgi:hypothetical protein
LDKVQFGRNSPFEFDEVAQQAASLDKVQFGRNSPFEFDEVTQQGDTCEAA